MVTVPSADILERLRGLLGKERSLRQLGLTTEADSYAAAIDRHLDKYQLTKEEVLESGEVYGYGALAPPPPPPKPRVASNDALWQFFGRPPKKSRPKAKTPPLTPALKQWYRKGYNKALAGFVRKAPQATQEEQVAWYRGFDARRRFEGNR